MSSTAAGGSNYVDFDEYVDLKLQKTRSTIKSTDILVALAGVAAMFLSYLLVFVIFDQWVVPGGFGIGLRWVLLSTLLILTTAWLGWKVGIPYLRSVNRLFAAREIEKADPELKSNLLNLVDLRTSGRPVDPAILRALEKNAAVGLQKVDVAQAIDHRPLMRMAYVLLAVVVMFCLYALLSPKKISTSIWRSLMPASNVGVSTRTEIVNVQPGDQTVLAGVKIPVSADIAGEIPEKVWLHFTTADGKFRDEPVELRTDGEGPTRFKGILLGENGLGVLQDLRYVIRAGDAVSDEYLINVKQPPSANVDRIAMQFPSYMKLEQTEQVGGQIEAWEGTKVTLTAHTNIPVKSARIEFLDTPDGKPTGEEVLMSIATDGRQLTGSWTLEFRSDDTYPKAYQVQCKTESGEQDPNPIKYGLIIRKDMPPEVTLLDPVRDLEVPANTAAIPLLIEAHDPDFELSHINLHVKKNGQVVHKEPLSEGRQQRILLKPDLKLERFALKPGDLIEFWVQAFDNKQPRPNSKVTPELKVKIVDPVAEKEARQQVAENQAKRDERLKEAEADQNQEARPDQQPPEGKNDERQPQDPKRDQQPQQPNEKRDEQKGPEQQDDPNAKGTETKSAPGKGTRNDKQVRQNKTENDKPGDQKLDSEGDDDGQALKQILESLNKDQNKQKSDSTDNTKPNGSAGEKNQDKTDKTNKTEEPSKTDEGNNTEPMPKPGEEGTKPMPGPNEKNSRAKPDNKDPNKTPNENPADNGTNPDPSQGTKPKNSDATKPGENAAKPEKTQPDKTGSKPKSSDPSNPGETPKPDKTGTNPKTSEGTNPGDNSNSEKNTGPGENPSADKPKTEGANPERPDKTTKPTPQPGQEGTDPQPEKPEQPGAKGTEAGPGKNEPPKGNNPPKQEGTGAGAEKKPSKSPMDNGTTGEKKGPTPDGPEEQVADSPGAQKKPADGTETGTGKADKEPGPKPTRSENPDLQRDPNEKPAKKPGEGKPNDPNNPAKSDSDNNVQNPKPRAGGPEKQKIDQEPGDKPKAPPGKNPDTRPGDPNAANEELKGPGEKNQRSKEGSGGETGSSKEDREGKPGSSNSGEGDKTDRPGGQQTADKQSNQPGGKKEPGKGTEGKGGEKQAGGGKEGKPGSEGGGEPGEAKGGKPGDGSQQSPEGQGGEGGQPGKPGQARGKTQPGKGPNGQQGGNVPNGAGQRAPDEMPAGNGNAEAVEDGEEANLEYKKQATELVLKRLQEGLERGDVDPELLKKLGWTEEEMRRFADRLSKHLQDAKSDEATPESIARKQQFEEMLKSLDLNRKGTVRQGAGAPQREVDQVGPRHTTVPKEYRSAGEKFSREITRQKKPAQK